MLFEDCKGKRIDGWGKLAVQVWVPARAKIIVRETVASIYKTIWNLQIYWSLFDFDFDFDLVVVVRN